MNRRAHDAGFTLVELTVALAAGLIVALGITALSREATRTFHEEARSSAAESTLRTAVDRIRADLQRASYMSSSNVVADALPPLQRLAGAPGNVGIPNNAPLGILRLAGIRLIQGGSATNNNIPLSANQPNALAPDAIEIGGNMTCAEQFEIQSIQSVGNCARLMLSATAPALFRINAVGPTGPPSASQTAELNNVFQPDGASQFIVRILDDTGRSQYLPTCSGANAATGVQAGVPFVAVSTTPNGILSPANTGGQGGVTNTPGGRAWVNPVQVIRWEITNAANEPAQYANALARQSIGDGGVDPNKYDLIRSYVDINGAVVPATTEVVAEYAVDLSFAFSVESGVTAQSPAVTAFAFGDAANQTWANDVSTTPGTQPQHIRSVRVRVATRAAQADRTLNIPVNGANTAAGTFLYRYCVLTPCTTTDANYRWARARTLTTEVSLPNQAGFF